VYNVAREQNDRNIYFIAIQKVRHVFFANVRFKISMFSFPSSFIYIKDLSIISGLCIAKMHIVVPQS
jgi:hypothetical protein